MFIIYRLNLIKINNVKCKCIFYTLCMELFMSQILYTFREIPIRDVINFIYSFSAIK